MFLYQLGYNHKNGVLLTLASTLSTRNYLLRTRLPTAISCPMVPLLCRFFCPTNSVSFLLSNYDTQELPVLPINVESPGIEPGKVPCQDTVRTMRQPLNLNRRGGTGNRTPITYLQGRCNAVIRYPHNAVTTPDC